MNRSQGSNNWLWFAIPSGCLGICALVCCGIIGAGFWGAKTMISSAEPYKHSIELANNHTELQQELGTPIEAGWASNVSISLNGNRGSCDLRLPISGPEGSGMMHVIGTKRGGNWTYEEITVTLDDDPDRKIDLQAEDPPDEPIREDGAIDATGDSIGNETETTREESNDGSSDTEGSGTEASDVELSAPLSGADR